MFLPFIKSTIHTQKSSVSKVSQLADGGNLILSLLLIDMSSEKKTKIQETRVSFSYLNAFVFSKQWSAVSPPRLSVLTACVTHGCVSLIGVAATGFSLVEIIIQNHNQPVSPAACWLCLCCP